MSEALHPSPQPREQVGLGEIQRVRREHRDMVEAPRRKARTLREFGRFVGDLQRIIARKPGTPNEGAGFETTGRAPTITDDEREKLLDRVARIGGDRQLAMNLFFGGEEEGLERFLLAENQSIFESVGMGDQKFLTINTNIIDACSQIFAQVAEMGPLLSTEDTIPVTAPQGDTIVLSPRNVFAHQKFGQLENFPNSMASWQESTAEAATTDLNLAIYDSYQWAREVSRKVTSGEISFIYPTPYTESIKDAIRTAHAKRNGILKYILFGEAGTGKTRLIQETDKENGRETVLINCHRFISFEDLIGHAAITVDIGGNTTIERLKTLTDQYQEDVSPDKFWTDMTNLYEHLPASSRQQYKSVEDMVDQFDPGVGNVIAATGEDANDREAIRRRFIKRNRAALDMAILGFAPEKDLPARLVQGVLLYCIDNNKVPCFDEMDKAGPEGIESMLSFLSMSPGELWRFQGGEKLIPHNFYATATSNARNIGVMKDVVLQRSYNGNKVELDESMNRFLADRSEQITIQPQPVKDALMIAAINLSNENGDLLIDATEQVQLVNAFSYILPRLQKAGLSIPITNRIINTICSRLVEVRRDNEHTYYQRVSNPKSGEPQTVAEAIELSILHLKGASLGTQGEEKVRGVIHEFLSLIDNQEIPSFGDDLMLDVPTSRVERYNDMASKIWESPLYRAISLLQSDPLVFSRHKFRKLEGSSLRDIDFDALFAKTPSLEVRKLGCQNGIILEPTASGIKMRSQIDPSDQDGQAIGEQIVSSGYFPDSVISAADQLGESFVIRRADGTQELFIKRNSEGRRERADYFIDPLGRYFIKQDEGGRLSLKLIEDDNYQSPVTISSRAELLDVSPNGNMVIYKENENLFVVDISMFAQGDKNLRSRLLTYPGWESAKFLGNGMIVGVNDQKQLAKQADGNLTVIAVT